MALSKVYYHSKCYEPPAPASRPSSKAVNNDLYMQASLPKAEHNAIVPLANRKPEHFCDFNDM